VVAFYRGSWCAYCNLQLRAYAEVIDEIRSSGGRLVAVSPMTAEHSAEFAKNAELPFDVLADPGAAVAEAYGVAFELEGEGLAAYVSAGIDLPLMNGDNSWRLPAPSVFIVDREGIVRFARTDGDWRSRLEPSELVAAVLRIAAGHKP
jgi:peroxiredoxin